MKLVAAAALAAPWFDRIDRNPGKMRSPPASILVGMRISSWARPAEHMCADGWRIASLAILPFSTRAGAAPDTEDHVPGFLANDTSMRGLLPAFFLACSVCNLHRLRLVCL